MINRPLASALLALSIGPGAASAAEHGWTRYTNATFGTSAEVPPGFKAGSAPDAADGMAFASLDERAEIRVFGSRAPSVVTDGFDAYRTWMAEIEERAGWTLTNRARGEGWFALSAGREGTVQYQKVLSGCDGEVAHHVRITYPAEDRGRYDGIVSRLARSLGAGVRAC